MLEMGCVCLPLVNPSISRKVGITYRRRYQLSVAATAMKDMLVEYS
jgi:hypothetical protein